MINSSSWFLGSFLLQLSVTFVLSTLGMMYGNLISLVYSVLNPTYCKSLLF
uniref:Uncharacterized protein n=1 Tax=Rhizophora mucronata TaxID=61149 RepID=A0A2P2KAQ2_RHIMU